jgi:hypothetical protein
LKIAFNGQEVMFERKNVAVVFERGDSVKNGAIIGLSAAALGVLVGTQPSLCGTPLQEPMYSCTANERVKNGIVGAALYGALGAAIGAAVDALHTGQKVLYERPKATSPKSFAIAPTLAPSSLSLPTRVP